MKTSPSSKKFEIKKEYDFSKAVRGRFYKPKKIQKTLRLDEDTILFFQKLALIRKVGYQTLINEALRKMMNHQDL
jgi:uncharacterized protein (DUF4415 family)